MNINRSFFPCQGTLIAEMWILPLSQSSVRPKFVCSFQRKLDYFFSLICTSLEKGPVLFYTFFKNKKK